VHLGCVCSQSTCKPLGSNLKFKIPLLLGKKPLTTEARCASTGCSLISSRDLWSYLSCTLLKYLHKMQDKCPGLIGCHKCHFLLAWTGNNAVIYLQAWAIAKSKMFRKVEHEWLRLALLTIIRTALVNKASGVLYRYDKLLGLYHFKLPSCHVKVQGTVSVNLAAWPRASSTGLIKWWSDDLSMRPRIWDCRSCVLKVRTINFPCLYFTVLLIQQTPQNCCFIAMCMSDG